MKTKKILCMLLVLCMSFTLCVPVLASESEPLEIEVNDETDIAEFILSDEFDPHATYRFVYPDSTVMPRILCPNCGYNTLVGKKFEEYDLCHPSIQGMTVQCPHDFFAPDAFYVMLVNLYRYCNTCGYKDRTGTFIESKFYIVCSSHYDTLYIATDDRTNARDEHEFKETWYLYYNDPHYS